MTACNRHPRAAHGSDGFSYVEVLVALLVLGISLPPALDALSGAMRATAANNTSIARRYRAKALMENVLAQTHASLDAAGVAAGSATTPTTYSDAAGTQDRRLVFIARYDFDDADADGNPFTGGDSGLLWVRVQLENASAIELVSLTAP